MTDIAILRLADAAARHAAKRHELVARNIANSDTPGFRARDLTRFDAAMGDAFSPRATRPTHLHGGDSAMYREIEDSAFGAAKPNGNTVSLTDQMARGAEVMGDHDRATTIYGKTVAILRAGMGRK